MYEQHWGLNVNPFADTSDPKFFFRSHTHQAALLKLRYLVENRKGAGLLVGGNGCGKTYLAAQLVQELSDGFNPVVHLVFPQLSPGELMAYLAIKLGAPESAIGDREGGLDRTIRQIEERLTAFAHEGRHPVIIIDEAHSITDWNVFQTLQLLLNYRRPPDTDFSLILIGEPSLLPRIGRLRALEDRVAVKSLLRPLTREETARYVLFRLEVAGLSETIFDERAFDELFELSGGIPRQINRICDLALLVGYADGLTGLSASHVEAVSEELTAVVSD